MLEENQQQELNNNMLRQEIDNLQLENEQKDQHERELEQRVKDLELELKFSALQIQGQIDGELVAHQYENAANSAAQNKIVLSHLEEKNKTIASSLVISKAAE